MEIIKFLKIIIIFFISVNIFPKKFDIAVLGCGYVGLVYGPGLSYFQHKVICTDIDKKRIQNLNNGENVIFEKGLDELIKNGVKEKNLFFSDNIDETIQKAEIIVIAVPTPSNTDGTADLKYVENAANTIAKNLNNYKVIIMKSTVPIGTSKYIKKIITENSKNNFDIVSNPEFLREGSALEDFFNPDRIVIGCDSKKAIDIVLDLYSQFIEKHVPIILTDNNSAELIKYASNSFLATKISFINEISNICEVLNANIADVKKGMGLDNRIGHHFLNPGPGFGGSCFPKDVKALIATAKQKNIDLKIINATLQVNDEQITFAINKIKKHLGNNLKGKKITILGLAFKAGTDDIRESPSIKIINQLLKENAKISAYDPFAMDNAKKILEIEFCNNMYDACKNSDALVIATEWQEFKNLNFELVKNDLKQTIIIDLRNILDIKKINNKFIFENMGNYK